MSERPPPDEPMGQSFCIPDVGPSANTIYAGMHWRKRKAIADTWHLLVRVWVRKYGIHPVDGLVDIQIECWFGPGRKAFDSSNCSFTLKLIEDGLVAAKILKGDGPQYVGWVNGRSVPRQITTQTVVTIYELV